MDKFKRIIDGGYSGFNTGDARQIIRDSTEVSQYIESKRAHFTYVQQLMNDKIIDEAMGRVKAKGDFVFDREEGVFSYRPNQIQTRQVLSEQYPTQTVYPSYRQQQTPQDNIAARLDAMEREMKALREENKVLKSRYEMLK
jgi:hypothetical protein